VIESSAALALAAITASHSAHRDGVQAPFAASAVVVAAKVAASVLALAPSVRPPVTARPANDRPTVLRDIDLLLEVAPLARLTKHVPAPRAQVGGLMWPQSAQHDAHVQRVAARTQLRRTADATPSTRVTGLPSAPAGVAVTFPRWGESISSVPRPGVPTSSTSGTPDTGPTSRGRRWRGARRRGRRPT
jgi:hypothetical protein